MRPRFGERQTLRRLTAEAADGADAAGRGARGWSARYPNRGSRRGAELAEAKPWLGKRHIDPRGSCFPSANSAKSAVKNSAIAVGGLDEAAIWRTPNIPEVNRGLRGLRRWPGGRICDLSNLKSEISDLKSVPCPPSPERASTASPHAPCLHPRHPCHPRSKLRLPLSPALPPLTESRPGRRRTRREPGGSGHPTSRARPARPEAGSWRPAPGR